MRPEIRTEEIDKFLRRNGKKGERLLSTLGRSVAFYEAINSEIGQEILKDAIHRMDEILEKIILETASDQEKGEFRALKSVTLTWSERIKGYLDGIKEIRGGRQVGL